MRLRFVSFVLLLIFGIITINAQVSIGAKYSYIRSGYGEKGKYNKKTLSHAGSHKAFLFNIKLGKYVSIGLEPGVSKEEFDYNDFAIFREAIIEFFDTPPFVYQIDVPMHCSLRYPILKDRLEIYSKFGVRANYVGEEMSVIFSGEEHTTKQLLKGIDQDFDPAKIVMYRSLGFGTSLRLGRHHLFVELERFKKFKNEDFFTKRSENLKEVQFGVGYLFMLG